MIKLIDIIKDNYRYSGFPNKSKILYLSNVALIPFEDILIYNLRLLGVHSDVKTSLFNSLVTDINNHSSNHEAIIINHDPFSLLLEPDFHLRKVTSVELRNLEKNYIQLINQVLINVPSDKLIIFISLLKPEIIEFNENDKQVKKIVDKCNLFLKSLENKKVKVIDLQKLITILGQGRSFKRDFSLVDPSIYTLDFVKYLSEIIAATLANQLLPFKKLLVLDCDNTIWGGVAAEVGYESIDIGKLSQSGKVFLELQILFKELSENGVILSLCSKNNEQNVLEVFEQNKNMILMLNQFIIKKINWKPKSQNILETCVELNISPNSAVFIDDSLFEIQEVISSQQKISCLQTPKIIFEVELLRWKLEILFLSKVVTREDINKTRYYQDEEVRKQQVQKFLKYEDYLKSLDTKIELIQCSDNAYMDRVIQLSLKTNQFNFMYSRIDEDSINLMLRDERFKIYIGAVSDNVGDTGVVFLLITESSLNNLKHIRIIEVVLSCRVFGRNIAECAVIYIIEYLRRLGYEQILCAFKETNKNSQFNQFLPLLGFRLYSKNDRTNEYILNLLEYDLPYYDYPIIKANF